MPWTCDSCGHEVETDTSACPGCKSSKTSWTVVPDVTRGLIVPQRKRFKVLRGGSTGSFPPDHPSQESDEIFEAEQAWVLHRARLQQVAVFGHLPPTEYTLYVRVWPGKTEDPQVEVRVDFAREDEVVHTFPLGAETLRPEGYHQLPLVCWFGGQDIPLGEGAFPGFHLLDLSEGTSRGYAPGIEVSALGLTPVELPTLQVSHDLGDAFTLPTTLFAFDSAFPTPGIAPYLDRVCQAAKTDPQLTFGVFGHTDSDGKDAYNKGLSDRRAQTVYALLTGDIERFMAIAEEEEWGLAVHQAMLRTLGCNPGAIDGEAGEMTENAVRMFQRDCNQGYFRAASPSPALAEDGDLGPKTREQLRRAYAAGYSLDLSPERFHGPKHSGCSEFNPIFTEKEMNRRVTLAVYRDDPPDPASFPCVVGDHTACPLVSATADSPFRCSFYREHIKEELDFEAQLRPFHDMQWIPTPSEKVHMSALTSLPDGTPVTFQVFRCAEGLPRPHPEWSQDADPPSLGTAVTEKIEGVVRYGVALTLWDPPEGQDPFDVESWYVDVDPGAEFDPVAVFNRTDTFQPPVFRVEAPEDFVWGVSRPPGRRLDRMHLEQEGHRGVALTTEGGFVRFRAKGQRAHVPEKPLAEPHLEVTTFGAGWRRKEVSDG